jgi:hypothetical protein
LKPACPSLEALSHGVPRTDSALDAVGRERSPRLAHLRRLRPGADLPSQKALCGGERFYGTSENAVKSQIWIAVSIYVLVAIVKKRLNLDASLYTLLQILSVTLLEKMALRQAVTGVDYKRDNDVQCNQLNLFAV